jgi:DNA-binding NtrC family response regulator
MDRASVRILVVDDDQRLLDLLNDTLVTIGYVSSSVVSAKAALDTLSKRSFDLVITDISMPDMDGIELLNKIREKYPKLPVVFITGAPKPDLIGKPHPEGLLAKPFRISNLEELIDKTLSGKEEKLDTFSRRVLVIDDDDNYREMLTEALKVGEYTAIPAASAQEAMEILESCAVDAVITDIKMPDMNGVNLAKAIKEKHPDLPVILITAYHDFDRYFLDEQKKDADGILQKPFGLELILDLLKKVIGNSEKSAV